MVVEAVRWTGDNMDEVEGFVDADWKRSVGPGILRCLVIRTLEGEMIAQAGDWIIRGVAGEYYPCKNDIFERTYEEAGDE